MNGIEQIRKANELSKVLKTHGLAQDSFDAIKQAHKLTNKERNSVLEVNPSSLKQEIQEQTNTTRISESMNHKLQSFERSKHLMNERIDKFSIKFEQLEQENKQLKTRLEAIESKLNFLSRGSGAASSATNPPVTTAPASSHNLESPINQSHINQARGHTAAQLSATPTNSSSANAPGNTGIDPNSVSIENIFYYGKK